LENQDFRLRMGEAGHKRVQEHFTAEGTAFQIMNIIDQNIR